MSRRRSSGNLDAKVYVGDIARDVSERDLEKVFKQFGSLRSVWVARNPPGFAFIEFDDERDAADAIKELDGREVCGSRVRVRAGNDYPSRSSRPSRRSPETLRKPFDPQDRCYRCNQRGHYAYDCDKYNKGGRDSRRSRSDSRSPSRDRRRRSYSRSRSQDRYRRRSRS